MKKFTIVILAVLCTIFSGCSNKNRKLTFYSEHDSLVESISDSLLERDSPICISFTREFAVEPEKAFSTSPKQAGKWERLNSNTVTFTPTKPYKSDICFDVTCDVAKLFGDDSLKQNAKGIYRHSFTTQKESLEVTLERFELSDDGETYDITGNVTTDIICGTDKLNKIISCKLGSKKMELQWYVNEETGNSKYFTIYDVPRKSSKSTLSLFWKGASNLFSRKLKGKKSVVIPAKGIFEIIDVFTSKANRIIVSFSDAIADGFPISSYITNADKADDLAVYTDDNVVEIYSDNNFYPLTELTLESGIKSVSGAYLAQSKTFNLDSNWVIPSATFALDGNILPTSQGTSVPIITQNVSGVTVNAYEIYDHNILQFLQVNELDGNNEIKRVSNLVWSKHFSFDWNESMQNKKISRGLDISELTKQYPGGMVRLELRFDKADSKYVCTKSHKDFSNLKPIPEDDPERETSYWDYSDMDWDEYYSCRQNCKDPCHPAFYSTRFRKEISQKKNVLISDIGIMAKKTRDNKIYATIADLKTARPMQNVTVSFYNEAQHMIGSGKTDASGTVVFNDTKEPKFIIAEDKNQKSYLKLDEGTGLSVSHFETGGEISQTGIKGALYAERGVWRPGDDIYLTFVLLDTDNRFPDDFPVSFELINALGKTTDSRTIRENLNGFYSIQTSTDEDDVTGLWKAKITAGGQEWTKNLRIETVVPNKLDVDLTMDSKEMQAGNDINFTLKGAYLHGAPAAGFKADVNLVFNGLDNSFPEYSEYSFTTPEGFTLPSRTNLWEGNLDDDSKVNFDVKINSDGSLPGKLKASLISRIFEPNDAFSVSQQNITFSPYSEYIGLKTPKGDAARGMLLTDTDHTADVMLLNPDGSKVPSGEAEWALYKLEWKWWWEKDALTNATYVSGESYNKLSSGIVKINEGHGNFTFRQDYPSWGRYLLKVTDKASGHSAGKILYIDWPNWAGRSTEKGAGSANMLTVSTDKKQYTAGEKATITFASGKKQKAHITIERNGKILRQEWIDTKDQTTNWSFDLTNEMSPNVYVHVTLLQEHLQSANSLPMRLYGVVPVMVENPETYLEPVITSKDVFEPNTECTVSVSEKNGKPMTYTIAIVDNGLLNLTNYHAEKLHDYFFKKEASSLTSWDIYSYVMNAYSGKLETLLSIGGGDDFGEMPDTSVDRFKPVVKYFGPFQLKAGEKKATVFEMPAYVGSVRAMVVAGSNNAFGTTEKNITVKSDLMVQTVAPRNIGVDETINIPVTVFNNTARKENISLTFKATGCLEKTETKQVSINANDKSILYFTVSPENSGKSVFEITAKSSSKQTGEKYDVEIMHRGQEVTYVSNYEIKAGKKMDLSVESPFGKNIENLELEVSGLPALNLSKRVDYLINYPHGCIEQITSAGFGQLILPDVMDLSQEQISNIQTNVRAVIENYPKYAASLGGFGYWPGNTTENVWGTCYAAHFIVEARKRGYTVPSSIVNPLFAYLDSSASAFSITTNTDKMSEQAYRLYVLALNGKPNLGAMNRMAESKDINDSSETILLLASAYALSGKTDVAKRLISKVDRFFREERETGGSFGSPLKEKAILLFAETLIGGTNTDSLTKEIIKKVSSEDWLSTQEVAWSLLSLLPRYKDISKTPLFTISSNTETVQTSSVRASIVKQLKPDASSEQKISFKNESSITLYAILRAKGRALPGSEITENNGLGMLCNYFINDRPANPRNIKKGDNIHLVVNVQNNTDKPVENIALTVPRPTGIEFANDRITNDEEGKFQEYSYQDIRDDGIYTYFDLKPKQTITLEFNMTSVYDGKYFVPAIHAEAMYDNDIHAIHAGNVIQ